MKKILLVIDMQKYFSAANEPYTITECRRLIRKFVKNKDYIIFVEYAAYGVTLEKLRSIVPKGYRYFHVIKKSVNNGSQIVYNSMVRRKIKSKDITVCGVNSDCCVRGTSEGLASLGYDITVVKKACNRNKTYGLTKKDKSGFPIYKLLPNLRLV